MSITNQVEENIKQFEQGQLFTYNDIKISNDSPYALPKVLSRLVKDGTIERFKKGIFYKPKKTRFGTLKPSEQQILASILRDNKNLPYVTGLTIYNKWGLTTQIPNQVIIATSVMKKPQKIGGLNIKYVKKNILASKNDIGQLQLLDAIKDFKKIPDREDQTFVEIITRRINQFTESEKLRLIELAKQYPPRTRALLGAILELDEQEKFFNPLKTSLNPLTKYKLGISEKVLPNKKHWNIL